MDPAERARAYYAALDAGDYAELSELLAPEFAHDRPDLTLEGRDRFLRFMREERPRPDATHAVDAVYAGERGVAVRGRLLGGDGDLLIGFVDAFSFEGGRIERITTYTK